MWNRDNKEAYNNREYTRTKKVLRFDDMEEDSYLDKESMQSSSSMKTDEVSMYENDSHIAVSENFSTHCSYGNRPLKNLDSNSPDSGYGVGYAGKNGKFLSYASPATSNSFETNCMSSMEDEYLDFSNVESLEKPSNLPQDFTKLISEPLAPSRVKSREEISPNDTILRPLFRRALSLQCTNTKVTPISSRMRTSLFKSGESEIPSNKRPASPTEMEVTTVVKRSRMFDVDEEGTSVPEALPLQHAFPATEESIMSALQRSSTEPDLIGDFSKSFSLPLTQSRHEDLKAITPATLAQLMKGYYMKTIASFKVIDCRYPYEFDGGHIYGATNIYTRDQCRELLDAKNVSNLNPQKRNILVFHCEFSSQRGPNLYRFLRKEDRQKHENAYPNLFYPEIYLLEGGYKNFFSQFPEMCIPIAYKEMLHPDHGDDLRHFKQKSKTWNCDSRHQPQSRRNRKRLGLCRFEASP